MLKVIISIVIFSAWSTISYANCNASCEPGANTQPAHVAYCKALTNGGTTTMPSGKTLSQESCEQNNAIFGCVWKKAKQEKYKCFGGVNLSEKAACKQQNNLPQEIVELACENLAVVSKCQYDLTCD